MTKIFALLVAVISSVYGGSALALTAAEINTLVVMHNRYRLQHGSPPVQWSDAIAQTAQAWANQCSYQHDQYTPYGENLFWGGTLAPNQVVDAWYDTNYAGWRERTYYEQKSANYTNNRPTTQAEWNQDNPAGGPQYGHFTQLVWKSTTQIGCGFTNCSGTYYWVCRYSPHGNYLGQFGVNVLSPASAVNAQNIPATYELGASSWGNGRYDVWAAPYKYVSSNQDLAWRKWDGELHEWVQVGGTGGPVTSGPSGDNWGSGYYHVFARGPGNTLIHRTMINEVWSNWETIGLGDPLKSAPAVTAWANGRLDVFAQGQNDNLLHWWYSSSSWHYETIDGNFASAPAAVSWGSSRIDIFVRGKNNALYWKYFDSGWHGWYCLGETLTSAPTVASWAPGRLDVFFRGGNFKLYRKIYDQGSWQLSTLMNADTYVSSPAAVAWNVGNMEVFIRSTNNNVRQFWLNTNGNWSSWDWDAPPF